MRDPHDCTCPNQNCPQHPGGQGGEFIPIIVPPAVKRVKSDLRCTYRPDCQCADCRSTRAKVRITYRKLFEDVPCGDVDDYDLLPGVDDERIPRFPTGPGEATRGIHSPGAAWEGADDWDLLEDE